jgi:5'-deoxynucleotidase YfbR-like HD superfamily hydrolase
MKPFEPTLPRQAGARPGAGTGKVTRMPLIHDIVEIDTGDPWL